MFPMAGAGLHLSAPAQSARDNPVYHMLVYGIVLAMIAAPVITFVEAPTRAMREAIVSPLVRFNEERAGRPEDDRPLAVLLSDVSTGEVVGGLWGETMFDHLHVDLLFVPEEQRKSGVGRQLIERAEEEARRRGCRGVWLDTYSFQARGFYERLGYEVFGSIEDFPPGHSRFFLRKVL
jgi:GNAT superfamily N-acetyltransferase